MDVILYHKTKTKVDMPRLLYKIQYNTQFALTTLYEWLYDTPSLRKKKCGDARYVHTKTYKKPYTNRLMYVLLWTNLGGLGYPLHFQISIWY